MSIKEFLAEGNKDFISLYDLLKKLEKQQNVTHQEAAAWLYRLQKRNDFPTWYYFSIAGGKETFDGIENGVVTYLFLVASGTSLSNSFFHDLQVKNYLLRAKELGFSANEMMEFLAGKGVIISLNEDTQPVLQERKQQAKEEKARLQENSEAKQEQGKDIGEPTGKSRTSFQNAMAAMFNELLESKKKENPKITKTELICKLAHNYSGYIGLSESFLKQNITQGQQNLGYVEEK